MAEGNELKIFLQNEKMWEKDLFYCLINGGIKTPQDIANIDQQQFDHMMRQLRITRSANLKDKNSFDRFEKLLGKFEKHWRKVSVDLQNKKTKLKKNEDSEEFKNKTLSKRLSKYNDVFAPNEEAQKNVVHMEKI